MYSYESNQTYSSMDKNLESLKNKTFVFFEIQTALADLKKNSNERNLFFFGVARCMVGREYFDKCYNF